MIGVTGGTRQDLMKIVLIHMTLTPHDSIDLLLDLNARTLLYYSNQTFHGVLKNSLKGEYVWFLSL